MLRLRPTLVALLSAAPALTLAGCGMIGSSLSPGASTPAAAATQQGRVIGGQQPVSGATIHLYAVSTTADGAPATPLLTSAVTSDASGFFTLTGRYTCPSPSPLVYLTATGGNPGLSAQNPSIALMTALGSCAMLTPSTTISVNEVTTVAAVTALAPFMRSFDSIGSSAIDAPALATAFTLATSLASPNTGQIPGPSLPVTAAAPNVTINTLADILAACINSAGGTAGDSSACGQLFASTTATGGPAPTNTIAAALNIMRDPQTNAASLFNLTSANAPFQPQLTAAPADWTISLSGAGAPAAVVNGCSSASLTGSSAFTNFQLQQPGMCRKLTAADLPAPNTAASSTNYSTQVARAPGQMPVVPPGFKVTLYVSGLSNARFLLPAANGDLFLAESSNNDIVVLRGVSASGTAVSRSVFAQGVSYPYGMAFYPSAANPQFLYVANYASLVRFPYAVGDTAATAGPTTLATDIPSNGGHATRTLAFTKEATPRLLVSVGSSSNYTNTDTSNDEYHRADILAYSVDGTFQKVFAAGLRNAVGLIVDPTGKIWVSVNERDGLGDNVPADYVTHVQEGGFYGWPWYYNGPNPEPRLPSTTAHPELQSATIAGDVLLNPHFAPLQIAMYTGTQFPTPYRGDLFVASHGSWNRAIRGGYELLRVHLVNGIATGQYEDFMTGFVNADGTVWGRPAGVAMGSDGALYVADDASNSIWRITYTGN